MIKIPSENIKELIRTKKNLEKQLNVKIEIQDNDAIVEGQAEDEYIAEKVIDAINFNFPVSIALLIRKEDAVFEILEIKNYTRKKDIRSIRARIIGTGGKTLQTLTTLTGCNFKMKENRVGIIGPPELIKKAQDALIFIIQGNKQANVYAFLERHRAAPVLDLGLKEKKKTKKKSKE